MNQANLNSKRKYLSVIKSILLFLFFLILVSVLVLYYLSSMFGDVFHSFLFTGPIFVIISILPFISKKKFSWAPISLFLYAVYCIYNAYLNFQYFHSIYVILLGVGVLLDFLYFCFDSYAQTSTVEIIKRAILVILLSIYTVSSVKLLSGIFSTRWWGTPFYPFLDNIYIPFTIGIMLIGFLFYSFLIIKPSKSINEKLLYMIAIVTFCTTFVLTLIMMILPIL